MQTCAAVHTRLRARRRGRARRSLRIPRSRLGVGLGRDGFNTERRQRVRAPLRRRPGDQFENTRPAVPVRAGQIGPARPRYQLGRTRDLPLRDALRYRLRSYGEHFRLHTVYLRDCGREAVGNGVDQREDHAQGQSGAVRRTTGALRARRLRRAHLRSQPVPGVPPLRYVPVVRPEYCSSFQTFQTFNRYAPFKSFKETRTPPNFQIRELLKCLTACVFEAMRSEKGLLSLDPTVFIFYGNIVS